LYSGPVNKISQKKFGNSSIYFGNAGYGQINNHADLSFGSGDFTIEMWIRPDDLATYTLFNKNVFIYGLNIMINSSGNLVFQASSASSSWDICNATLASGITALQWNHVVICRSGSSIYGFVGGQKGTPVTSSGAIVSDASVVCLGAVAGASPFYKGYMDEIRITKGKALYTSDFTPPTAPFTIADAGTVPAFTELPATPTATPDGSFNFIKVDKGLAIADRNIQSSISWDNLAIGGLVYGKGNKLRWKLPNPDVLPPNTVYGTAISPDSKYFVVGFDASPRIHIYENVNGSYVKLPNPDVLPTGGVYGNGLSFSSDSKYLAVSHLTSPFVTIYKITNGLFVKLPNPATLPAGTGRGCCFSDDGKYLAVTHTATPYFTIYKREANDVYTKLSNPATLPTSDGMTCSFSPDGNYLAIGGSDATILYVYSIANDVFTKLSNPSTLPSGTTYAVAFSKDSKYFAVAHGTSRFITIYSISGGSIVKLADPATLPTGIANGCSFDPNGNLIVNSTVSPYIFFYSKMGETFVKQDNPSTLPTGAGYGLCISKNGEEVYSSHATTPFVTIYKNLTTGTIRSLSGGTAYSTADGKSSTTDTSNGAWPPNNEWDTHIRKSTLNGKIVAGDNAVWNWNAPTRPWCMEAVAMSGMASNMRMARGRTSIDNISPDASTSVGTQYSFRPVLEWDEENQKVT